jgi:uncharacterized protein YdhG (YjbR/CyaY superfamily)
MASTFSKEERDAMKAAAAEAKAAKAGADLEAACLASIAEMTGTDKELAQIVHRLVTENTALKPKTWYGSPAYTNADGQVVVFFQAAGKFKVRYATLGFQPAAQLDEGGFWPVAYAVEALDAADQKKVLALITQAAG